jgi:hypothetical protein
MCRRDGKEPGWWKWPYPVYENGNRVHSFFRDMWWGMRQPTYDALRCAVEDIALRDAVPGQIVIAGCGLLLTTSLKCSKIRLL